MTASESEKFATYPTNYVSREDLLSCRPDLDGTIQSFSDWEVEQIADKIGEHLAETYWLTMEIILTERFGEATDAEG